MFSNSIVTGIARYVQGQASPGTSTESTISQAPEICSLYALDVSPARIRYAIRQKFENNRSVTDLRAIDVLIHKSRQDYQETVNLWKQNDHILGLFLTDEGQKAPKTFLQKFYEGEMLY